LCTQDLFSLADRMRWHGVVANGQAAQSIGLSEHEDDPYLRALR
jgi:hypothetical protein